MSRLRRNVLIGILVLTPVLGGGAWSGWFGGDELGDRCGGFLPVEEARAFFNGSDLVAHTHTPPSGEGDRWCSVAAADKSEGAVLVLRARPSAYADDNDARDEPGARPLGNGWDGSFTDEPRERPKAVVRVDCAPLEGKRLLVQAEATRDSAQLSSAQVARVARVATGAARLAAGEHECEGRLGQRAGAAGSGG